MNAGRMIAGGMSGGGSNGGGMIDIVLCASGSDEVRIVHGVATGHAASMRVVRRCADLAEVLAAAAAGIGDVVLIDLAVRGLDRGALADIMAHGLAVVGLAGPASADERPTALGLRHVVAADADLEVVTAAIAAALDPQSAQVDEGVAEEPAPPGPPGRLVVVWGPAGSPGRSLLAANLAHEAAIAGTPVILVDADTYGPSLAQNLGIVDEAPGLVAACRASARDTLDAATLEVLVPVVHPGLRLLSGIGVAARWPEVRASVLDGVWDALVATGSLVIVDVGFCLEEDEELSYDTMAPRRNAATTSALARADEVIAVALADPVSLTRLLREQDRLAEIGAPPPRVVVNRHAAPVPVDRVRDLVARRLPVQDVVVLPDDPATCRRAAWDGSLLSEAGPRTPLRRAVRDLAAQIAAPLVEAAGFETAPGSAAGAGGPAAPGSSSTLAGRRRRRGRMRA